jgi:two-component system nitrogen regulation sensor histidine kinase NtrY
MPSEPQNSVDTPNGVKDRLSNALRSGKLYPPIEIASVIFMIAVLAFSYWIVDRHQQRDILLPATLTAALLVANLVPAMALMALVARRLALRRATDTLDEGQGRLHVRFVALFSLISSIPVLLVVIFASLLFQFGVEFWFSERARTMLENANEMARGYYEDSRRDVGAETVAMASDLRVYLGQTQIDSPEFAEAYILQLVSRKLNESAIVEKGDDGVIRTAAIIDPDNRSSADRVTPEIVAQLEAGEDIVISTRSDRIEAVTTLDREASIYLYTARVSNQYALGQWERAQTVLVDYEALYSRSASLQIRFNAALFVVSLLLVAIALWAALRFADRMVGPLTDLAGAARDISSGNFATRVENVVRPDEIGMLGRAFNRMAERLEAQTSALIKANSQLDDRRAFTEAVLESVTAGIISIDEDRKIRLINSTAQGMLQRDAEQCLGQNLADIAPQFTQLIDEGVGATIIQYSLDNDLLTLAVKTVRGPYGMVITFEDITRQLLDQRQAAWSDVARRIAHEIKNPLTPIQLAAERLKRRYSNKIDSEDAVFGDLTDTIVRQVGDLRNIVDEFSSFARLPKPVFREENFYELARQSILLQQVAHNDIEFILEGDMDEAELYCDRRQIGQAITNIVKNAVEAIEAKQAGNAPQPGKIRATVAANDSVVSLTLDDNGIGLPAERERIIEPYMTTREKGTGLGLAIVKKIVEEHLGEIRFESNAEQGTRVIMTFNATTLKLFAISDRRDDIPRAPKSPKDSVDSQTKQQKVS